MSVNAKTPIALYKANLELVLRIGTLLQENRQRWTALGATSTNEALQNTLAQTERLLTTNDWTSLSALPGENFWNSLGLGVRPMQASLESAAGNQAAFAAGLQEAFEAWRQQSADALGVDAIEFPASALADFMKAATANTVQDRNPPASARTRQAPAAAKAKSKPRAAAKTTAKPATKSKPRSAAKAKPAARAKAKPAAKPAKRTQK